MFSRCSVLGARCSVLDARCSGLAPRIRFILMQDETRNLKRGRVESLDVLRGLAVAGMIVVNNPGDWTAVYPPLMHAYWTGLTVADLVFPGFVFTMGAAVPFAVAR